MILLKNSKIVYNLTLDEVFEKIYNSNVDSLGDSIYEIKEWKNTEWVVKNGAMVKKEDIYIYIESMPDALLDYIIEDEKCLRIAMKHKIKKDGIKYKKIKSKYIITNFKKVYRQFVKCLDLINIKSYIEIKENDNKSIEITINTRININLPNKEGYEKYVNDIFHELLNNIEKRIS